MCRFIIRQKLQESLQNVQRMQQQIFNATQWLAQAYGMPHSAVMQ
jgi:hypothetical protein